jgi:hypothetical protein
MLLFAVCAVALALPLQAHSSSARTTDLTNVASVDHVVYCLCRKPEIDAIVRGRNVPTCAPFHEPPCVTDGVRESGSEGGGGSSGRRVCRDCVKGDVCASDEIPTAIRCLKLPRRSVPPAHYWLGTWLPDRTCDEGRCCCPEPEATFQTTVHGNVVAFTAEMRGECASYRSVTTILLDSVRSGHSGSSIVTSTRGRNNALMQAADLANANCSFRASCMGGHCWPNGKGHLLRGGDEDPRWGDSTFREGGEEGDTGELQLLLSKGELEWGERGDVRERRLDSGIPTGPPSGDDDDGIPSSSGPAVP